MRLSRRVEQFPSRSKNDLTGLALLFLGCGAGRGFLRAGQGLYDLNFPPSPKEGVPRLTNQLAQIWSRSGEKGWGLKAASHQTSKMESLL